MKSIRFKRKMSALATSFVAVMAVMATAGPAHAAEFKVTENCDVPWITCSSGDLVLWYNSKEIVQDGDSAFTAFYGDVYDHWGTSQYQGSTLSTYRYVFGHGGNGNGQYTKNNAASVENSSEVDNYRVYYNSGYSGTSQYFAKNDLWDGQDNLVNLITALKNNNASSHFA
jgi:hypothetical protein